jgi:ectoine utilization protein EutC
MKKTIVVLNEAEIRQCISLNKEALEEVVKGFTALAEGKVTLPPIMRIDVPENHGEVDVKTAYIHGVDSFAIKIAAGFFSNHKLGLPTGSGMMVLISSVTGNPIAILLDNGYLTDVRTGIAGAIAAKYLARKEIRVAGVIGSGMQARYQIRALRIVREFSKLMVYGIVSEEVDAYAREISKELEVEVIKSKDPETVVRQSDIVVTTTPSKEPYLLAEWLHPGLHITCMGSDSENKQELYTDVFAKADRIVCDRKSQAFRLGELHHAKDAAIIPEDEVIELGQLTSGEIPGRESEEEITVCDLTGVGIQDTQISRLAYHKAIERGFGLPIE